MKKIISILLCIAMSISSFNVYADENKTDSIQYGIIKYEYGVSDGEINNLHVMVNEGNVYVDAEQLCSILGYDVVVGESNISIYNKDYVFLPYISVMFTYNSTEVLYIPRIVGIYAGDLNYAAPCPAIKDGDIGWIPLEYSLLILNSSWIVINDVLFIQPCEKKILDVFYDVSKNMNDFTLSVMDFFGDNKKDFKKVANASRVVNGFNGLLDLEVSAWGDYFYTVFLNDSAFVDAKYGDKIASLLCISSDEEYQQSLDRMETINDIFSSEGSIGDFLSVINESLDENVGALEKKCEELLKQLDGSNLSVYRYNKSYQELEDALETQQQFLNTGGFIMDVEDSVTDMTGKFDFFGQAFTGLDLLCKFGEIVGYVSEFQNQDQFTTDALSTYLSKRTEIAGNVPNGAVIAMMLSTASMESNVVVYSAYEYFKNNISDILNEMAKGSSLSSICLAEVQLAKFAWNFISQNVPFYSEGLSQTDAFETSLYTYIFETDMWKTYDARRKVILGNKDTLTSSYLYELAQLCYIYLKSCYIVQNTTLASIGEYLSDGNIKKLENNCDTLVEYMAILKSADTVTDEKYKGLLYGFLPENNVTYINEYNPNVFIDLIYHETELNKDNTYILPESNTRIYDISEIQSLTEEELEIARNEIFARHGRKFKREDLQEYFEGKGWYEGTIEPDDFDDDAMLSDIEKANLELIRSVEEGTIFVDYNELYSAFLMEHPCVIYEQFDDVSFSADDISYINWYTLYDIDKDTIPELFTMTEVNIRWEIINIYKISDGQVVRYTFDDGTNATFDNCYVANGGYFFDICSEGHIHNDFIGGLSTHQVTYLNIDNQLHKYLEFSDDDLTDADPLYTINGNEITSEEYNMYIENCIALNIEWLVNGDPIYVSYY